MAQIPHLTAFQTLFLRLKLPPPSSPAKTNRTILIWGGATAVGFHLIQLATLSGCRVITTASPANHSLLKSLGADVCFDYRDTDVLNKIKEVSGGVWAAIDTVVSHGSVENCIGGFLRVDLANYRCHRTYWRKGYHDSSTH